MKILSKVTMKCIKGNFLKVHTTIKINLKIKRFLIKVILEITIMDLVILEKVRIIRVVVYIKDYKIENKI